MPVASTYPVRLFQWKIVPLSLSNSRIWYRYKMNRSLNLKIKYFLPKKKKILSFFTHLPLLLTLLTLFPFLLALLSLSSNLCTYSLFLIILFTLFPSLLILLIHSLYHILLALFYSPFIALYSHFIPPSCLCTLSLSVLTSLCYRPSISPYSPY